MRFQQVHTQASVACPMDVDLMELTMRSIAVIRVNEVSVGLPVQMESYMVTSIKSKRQTNLLKS